MESTTIKFEVESQKLICGKSTELILRANVNKITWNGLFKRAFCELTLNKYSK